MIYVPNERRHLTEYSPYAQVRLINTQFLMSYCVDAYLVLIQCALNE